ncbi:DNA polymerase-3 subunit gamma/tau [Paucidesulfovibrio gracilis DSM 16080]|uniref:DNA polymerase III subunit gamma/tau n=1 Tax=Paucidesulfovibrio gracilis DSM 16080 TaxID=1121449 RepID=A0A1T4WIK8_9BACT|nr:DNA polymerase III subunit gamma/tau [Paucidesulfovibrio gracilis]SKA76999.1 DNA polymerase-3 subunit gamma/tau [Paucidesulfovibrio gracilis DSM 16080]
MSISSLTAKYRPQTFAEVAGQQAIKTILSRAAAENRVAPAYLFSGTRGVGKTTIARIFAKALNCVNAPTAEPCNECSRCRQATAGVFPDVIEIDGASHNKVEDARSLKEDIGYAPLEGRYKVIIIDEAHMLTVQAFNALLKTLEEPPPRVTFIMATTEVRKFPATIVSRCQHYVFQMLSQRELCEHLTGILDLEGLQYDAGALEIIAKRGAGSVRDSMSLLGQALALTQGVLREEDVRSFLGLAGQDVFFSLMQAIHDRDLVAVEQVLRGVLDQGLDLGFFLRELAGCWRNLFLLRQAGESALGLLNFSSDDAKAWLEWAGRFQPAQIHASWQMTLEGQRRVMTSMEPAMALELLLLNLASLPDLLDLESPSAPLPGPVRSNAAGVPQEGAAPAQPSNGPGGRPSNAAGSTKTQRAGHKESAFSSAPESGRGESPRGSAGRNRETSSVEEESEPPGLAATPENPAAETRAGKTYVDPDLGGDVLSRPFVAPGPPSWKGFCDYLKERNGDSDFSTTNLHGVSGTFAEGTLLMHCPNAFMGDRLRRGECGKAFRKLFHEYFGPDAQFRLEVDDGLAAMTNQERVKEIGEHPAVRRVCDLFDASVKEVLPRNLA